MPGKVNPVMCEMVMQVGVQVAGNDAVIALAGSHGDLELNAMMPVIAHNLIESIQLLANPSHVFVRRCVSGLTANRARCQNDIEQSLAMCTALAPVIGYDQAPEIAKVASESGRAIREVALAMSGLDKTTLDQLLDARIQTGPG